MKRFMDLFVAILLMVVTSPLWPLVALLVLIDGGLPILYKQARWGRGGRPFYLYKFRTMTPDAGSGAISPTLANDPRVSRIGRFLRARGLDELPQLLNILKGDMSFVGPRPLAVGEAISGSAAYEEMDGFAERQSVLPGLTGPATIYLPRDASAEAKFEADLRYVRDRSTGHDARLILLSVWISLRGRWESRAKKF